MKKAVTAMSVFLHVKNLRTTFHTAEGNVTAVDGVDLQVRHEEIVGIVGESGCGKSVMALSLMRLIPTPLGKVVAERMELNGVELQSLSHEQMRRVRGNEMSMIFQEPMSSLNPVFTVGEQIVEALQTHRRLDGVATRKRAIELLERVHIPAAFQRVDDYPHELSGGMRQRVIIAMALACEPALLIADEPTTALDVTIQAQILELLSQLQKEMGMAILFITHDLGVVAEMAKQVVVMYAGVVVETADVVSLFSQPLHPYTQGLLRSMPSDEAKQNRLQTIPGAVPNLLHLTTGCRFNSRCAHSMELCKQKEPPMFTHGDAHVRCWLYTEGVGR